MISRIWIRLCDYLKFSWNRLFNHLSDFWIVWALLLALVVFSYLSNWEMWVKYAVYIAAVAFVVYLLYKPMATVYGLVGGSAKIRTFLFNFFFITCLFSVIYYQLFFKEAGVCFDGETKLEYSLFRDYPDVDVLTLFDTTKTVINEERYTDSNIVIEQIIQTKVDSISYQRVTYWLVLKNSFLTSLTQGPSDFFLVVSDFGESMNTIANDKSRESIFSIILLLHVLISWLFLGVFISLLYSKFRYEA